MPRIWGKNSNFKGKKGKSGDKPDSVKFAKALELNKEKITQEALIELANNKVYKMLKKSKTLKDIQSMGLPITLKGMTDKKKIETDAWLANLLKKL